ncbi:MAG: AbgT family transporter [bacterium]|nr:AbgT family transporter [bacterium]
MKEKKKLKLKKFHFHPVTTFILLIILVIILSKIFFMLGVQATYSKLNLTTNELEKTLVTVEDLFNYEGIKYIISNATKNFISFTTLSTLLISLIGLSVSQATGFFDTFIKRVLSKIDKKKITFLIVFLSTISSLINEVGYVILIPLSAIIFLKTKRNPLAGIIAAFCGVAFGYGVTLFVGSMEVNLISTTEAAAKLIDPNYHVALTSNLIVIILTSIILSVVGTIIIEKIIIPRLGRYRENLDSTTEEIEELKTVEELEQQKLEEELREKKGLKNAFIATVLIIIFFIYALIPNLPYSGMLLDMEEYTYLNQVFGSNSYFQDGFTYLIALFFIVVGIAYGIGAKSIKNDKQLIIESSKYIADIGTLIISIFFAAQFIAIFKKTNIATIFTAWGANLINSVEFTGLPLILVVIIVIAIVNLFTTTPVAKWNILAPVVVPKLMQANISPEFAQFILRAGDSMTKGFTPILAFFVIFVGYLNMYNPNKNRPITIGKSLKMIAPYCFIISLVWIVIIILWYLTGLPIGPQVYPTL